MFKIKKNLESILLGYFLNQFQRVLKKETAGYKSLLDIGCGYNPYIKPITARIEHSVGLDAFEPSLEKAKKAETHSEFIKADVLTYLEKIPSNSFEIVMALDLIEHLEKEKGIWLMAQMERIASKKVLIFTPNGFVPQQPYDNNPWQEHKSGWDFNEMKEYGYRLYGFGGYKKLRGERFVLKYKPRIFWKVISFYSQIITHKNVKLAYSLLCIKDIRH